MGRLTTAIAALSTDANNLPPLDQLPNVSLIDALLPRSFAEFGSRNPAAKTKKPLDPNIGRKTHVTYYDIKRDKNGNKSIVRHKTPTGSVVSGGSKAKLEEERKECNCRCGCKICGATKAEQEKPENPDVEGKGEKVNETRDDGERKDKEKGSGEDKAKSTGKPFKPEEDARLKELKATGTNVAWRDIAKELKRPQAEVQVRWKEIKDNGDASKPTEAEKGESKNKEGSKGKGDKPLGTTGAAGGDPKPSTKAERKAARKAEKEKAEKENAATAATATAPLPIAAATATEPAAGTPKAPSVSKAASKHHFPSQRSEARFTMQEWQTLHEDDLFSFGELQCLSEIIMKDSSQTWLRVASRFYDLTGRRVHPEDIREKFEQSMEMGGQ